MDIDFIQDRACERIREILDALGVEYTERMDYLQGKCPIHNGDNDRAWFWAFTSRHWKCMTKHCEELESTGRSTSIFGLVRGILYSRTNKKYSFRQAVDFCAKVLGLDNSKIDPKTEEEVIIDSAIRAYRKKIQSNPSKHMMPLSEALRYMKPDTTYYPTRGITDEIISKYHISYCDKPDKKFYNRAYIPVLDETGRYVMGWTSRSIWEKCTQCGRYHDPAKICPKDKNNFRYAKWCHSVDFKAESLVYNIWYAKPFIKKTKTAIICEGPGDVWGYEMAGIHNAIAIFGLNMSPKQRQLLQNAGALTLILTLDNDDSAVEAQQRLRSSLELYFRVFCITPTAKDIGSMSATDILSEIKPQIDKCLRG